MIVLASASQDAIAIEEANQLAIPVLAITDTDMNPAKVTYPIPANDDAPKATELILRAIVAMPTAKMAKEPEASVVEETVVETAEPDKKVPKTKKAVNAQPKANQTITKPVAKNSPLKRKSK